MKCIITTCLCIILSFFYCTKETETSSSLIKFSEVYAGGDHICVDTGYSIGEKLTLINLSDGSLVSAKVEKETQYQEPEVGLNFPTMIILPEKSINLDKDKFISINYSPRKIETIQNNFENIKVSETGIPDSIIIKATSRNVGCSTFEENGLDSNSIRKMKISEKCDLVESNINNVGDGPRFLKFEELSYILNAPCSYKNLFVFKMDGDLYLYSGSHGCLCGATGIELHKISSGEIELIYHSWKWSL